MRCLGILALAVAILLVVVFFWFQSFIVHTPDGIRLDVPFLRGILDEIPEDASPDPILPPAEITPPPIVTENEQEDAYTPPEDFRTVRLSTAAFELVTDWPAMLRDFDVNALMIPMNNSAGMLWWDSEVALAGSYALNGDGRPEVFLEQTEDNTRRSAILYGFRNELMASRNPPMALTEDWLDPASPDVQAYLTDLALELARLGFNEIVLLDFTYPPAYRDAATAEVILTFLTELSGRLSRVGAELSLMTREGDWIDAYGEAAAFYPSFASLASIVTRFYCLLDAQTIPDSEQFAALEGVVASSLGQDAHRFVPGSFYARPSEGNWIIFPQNNELS